MRWPISLASRFSCCGWSCRKVVPAKIQKLKERHFDCGKESGNEGVIGSELVDTPGGYMDLPLLFTTKSNFHSQKDIHAA
jgi:hypothetical protein